MNGKEQSRDGEKGSGAGSGGQGWRAGMAGRDGAFCLALHPTPHAPHPPALASSDPFQGGCEYLNRVRQLAPNSGIIEVTDDLIDRIHICTWIGNHIDAVNSQLYACLEACHQCFSKSERREMQILAAPLSSRLGIDGLCNILLDPVAILVDVGRVAPSDWLGLVVHEYAHAHLKSPGHDRSFLQVLTHICLGLGLQPPPVESIDPRSGANQLRYWPHCNPVPDPLAFWKGIVN